MIPRSSLPTKLGFLARFSVLANIALLWLPVAPAQTTVAVSSLGNATGPATALGYFTWNSSTTFSEHAFSFTTGTGQTTLQSVTLKFNLNQGTPSGFGLGLYSGDSNGPTGSQIIGFTGAVSPGNPSTFTASTPTTLSSSTTYWLVATSAPTMPTNSSYALGYAPAGSFSSSLSGWSIGQSWGELIRQSSDAGVSFGSWGHYSVVPAFSVQVDTPVPEPSTYAAIFGALALGFATYKRRTR